MLEKSLSSQATFALGFSSAPQPSERLYMTLTHFREHYGLKRDLSRQRHGLFVVKASFPACSFFSTLSLHLYHLPPPESCHHTMVGALTGKRISISLPPDGPCKTWLMEAISLCHVFSTLPLNQRTAPHWRWEQITSPGSSPSLSLYEPPHLNEQSYRHEGGEGSTWSPLPENCDLKCPFFFTSGSFYLFLFFWF